jgi:hypothetical protein
MNNQDDWGSMHVFPNPIADGSVVSIAVEKLNAKVRVALIDIFGRTAQIIHDGQLKGASIAFPLDNYYAPGVYFLKLEIEGEIIQAQKVVVN